MNKKQQIYKLNRKLKESNVIDNKVKQLKKELKKVQEDYYKKVYDILKQIIELRKKQIKNYGIGELAREKGIDMTYHQIAYIFGMEHLSNKTQHLIDTGVIKTSTALFVIKQNSKMKEPKYQNAVIDMYKKGVLNTTELSRNMNQLISGDMNFNKEIKLANKQLISFSSYLQEKTKMVKSKRLLLQNKSTILYLIRQLDRLIDELQAIVTRLENKEKQKKKEEEKPISIDNYLKKQNITKLNN